jgi:hypothetical protein
VKVAVKFATFTLIGNVIQNGGNANNNCCRPGTGTTGLEADEEVVLEKDYDIHI